MRVSLSSTPRRLLMALLSLHLLYTQGASPYENEKSVQIIESHQEFVDQVQGSQGVWMLHLFTTATKKQVEIISALGKLMKGIFNVGVIDLTTCKDVEKIKDLYSVSASSLLVLGDDKKKPMTTLSTHDMDLQKLAEALSQAAGMTIQERSRNLEFVGSPGNFGFITVTDDTFSAQVLNNPLVVMVAFTAPWCGHCKKLEPEWKQAASALANKGAVLAWVDATKEDKLAARYGVKGYPTIKIFPGGTKKAKDAVDYQGERTAAAIVQAVLDEVDRSGVPPEIPQLTSMEVMEEHCAGSNHICILVALPHISDSGAEGRNKYKETVAKVAKSFRGAMAFSFLWLEGTSQPELEQALELTFGYPAVVALSMERKAYAVMRGSFSEQVITRFLHSLTTGKQATVPLQELPSIVTLDAWDGKDAAPIEEEFSLEDIMGDGDEL